MSRRAVNVAWLTVLWLVLWRDFSIANLLSGLVVGTVASGAGRHHDHRSTHRVHVLALARFVVYFLWKLVEANVVVAREVLTPRNSIHTGIIAVPLPGYSDFILTVVANAISLTPGTLTLEARPGPTPVLYVHVLHLHDLDESRLDVVRLAQHAAAAFPIVPPRSEEADR